MSDPTLYVVYNKNCGHVCYAANERTLAQDAITVLTLVGRFGWRIRAGATDEDLVALMAGDRCDVCTVDGQVTHVARA